VDTPKSAVCTRIATTRHILTSTGNKGKLNGVFISTCGPATLGGITSPGVDVGGVGGAPDATYHVGFVLDLDRYINQICVGTIAYTECGRRSPPDVVPF
jgi:hypothetical protein